MIRTSSKTLARGLGWFSIGLGLLEVVAPEKLGHLLGMEDRTGLLRGYGIREIGAGVGILSQGNAPSPGWLWARVGGDALDLATLLSALNTNHRQRRNVGIALGAVAGVTLLNVLCAAQLSAQHA